MIFPLNTPNNPIKQGSDTGIKVLFYIVIYLARKKKVVACNQLSYIMLMIRSFCHRGLEKYFLSGTKSGVQPEHERRIQLILSRLNVSISPKDMDLPGLRLHELTGKRKGTWSVSVSGNWRITFEFDGNDVIDVDYEDYH